MALRVCPECTEPVSEHAASCPHCGFRTLRAAGFVERPGGLVGAGVALLILGAAGGWAVRSRVAAPPPATTQAAAAASDECDCDCDDDSATDDHDEAATAPEPTSGPSALLIEAQDAYVHGEYSTAVRLAKEALPSEPTKAWRVIGAAECFMHDRAAAREAWSKLGPQERSFLTYVCGRNHVTLP
jgi:hypothetical protein